MANEQDIPSYNQTEMERIGAHHVEQILRGQYRQGSRFLTKWEGYGTSKSTWEPVRAFVHEDGKLNHVLVDYCLAHAPRFDTALRQARRISSTLKKKSGAEEPNGETATDNKEPGRGPRGPCPYPHGRRLAAPREAACGCSDGIGQGSLSLGVVPAWRFAPPRRGDCPGSSALTTSCLGMLAKPYPVSGPTPMLQIPHQLVEFLLCILFLYLNSLCILWLHLLWCLLLLHFTYSKISVENKTRPRLQDEQNPDQ